MIKSIRLQSQQLITPKFEKPKDLVAWMGAIQGQEYNMSKWAVGIRLANPSLQAVDDAIRKGEILRTHLLRPTWHLVTPEDIRWMIMLSGKRIKPSLALIEKELGLGAKQFLGGIQSIEKMVERQNLTRQEIITELEKTGITNATQSINAFTIYAEAEGIICSGVEKEGKHTYTLLEERVAPVKELNKDEALAKLAVMYFQSHSPATLNDFMWWSGLSITESRHAIELIKDRLIVDSKESNDFYIHQSYSDIKETEDVLHFIPPYDEYLISYKVRTDVLDLAHHPKAFTKYGIFYPVIMHNGKVVGNWKKSTKKGETVIETSFFDKNYKIDKKLIKQAEERYKKFIY
jgi:hypothetical protein